MKLFNKTLIAGAITVATIAANANTFVPLDEARIGYTVTELSNIEKQQLLDQAIWLFEKQYVNLDQKFAFYDDHLDPIAALQNIDVTQLSTEALNSELQRIFNAQRDLHLNFNTPIYNNVLAAVLPISMTRVQNIENRFQVAVDSLRPELLPAASAAQVEIGDEVVAYDGVPIKQAAMQFINDGAGANAFGGFIRALEQMTLFYAFQDGLPENDSVTLTLKKADGAVYDIVLPWYAFVLSPEPATVNSVQAITAESNNPRQQLKNEIRQDWLSGSELPVELWTDIPEGNLSFGTFTNDDGHFGVIKLTSFSPELDIDVVVDIIRFLMLTELANTDGLIFDVRENGGGSIDLSDKLRQLFGPNDARGTRAKVLNSPSNVLFTQLIGSLPGWPANIGNSLTGVTGKYSRVFNFTTDEDVNELGQAYYQPVGVLMNAESYSATDLFTCGIQDIGNGIIFGQDLRTGAGGANVWEYDVLEFVAPEYALPIPEGYDFRVSWGQIQRTGKFMDQLIEDEGCYADIDVGLTLDDLRGANNQVERITGELAKRASDNAPSVTVPFIEPSVLIPATEAKIAVGINNTNNVVVRVTNQDGAVVIDERRNTRGQTHIDVDLTTFAQSGESYQVELIGEKWWEARVWNLKRNIIIE
ncbi:S41 family peptidase [Salinibius halmophilus]|uniref:S41 family peptidase n=1 Tax=Salinibius halmophilus TaxID=1853216 RepID=UPI000E672AF6|nr:S41 family peptidase [Salinibius halmophilus]